MAQFNLTVPYDAVPMYTSLWSTFIKTYFSKPSKKDLEMTKETNLQHVYSHDTEHESEEDGDEKEIKDRSHAFDKTQAHVL